MEQLDSLTLKVDNLHKRVKELTNIVKNLNDLMILEGNRIDTLEKYNAKKESKTL